MPMNTPLVKEPLKTRNNHLADHAVSSISRGLRQASVGICAALCLMSVCQSARAQASSNWIGTDGQFNEAGNWSGTPPDTTTSNLQLVFGSGGTAGELDMNANVSVGQLLFNTGGYAIYGNVAPGPDDVITIAGQLGLAISSTATGTTTINAPVSFTGSGNVYIQQSGGGKTILEGYILNASGNYQQLIFQNYTSGTGVIQVGWSNSGNTTYNGNLLVQPQTQLLLNSGRGSAFGSGNEVFLNGGQLAIGTSSVTTQSLGLLYLYQTSSLNYLLGAGSTTVAGQFQFTGISGLSSTTQLDVFNWNNPTNAANLDKLFAASVANVTSIVFYAGANASGPIMGVGVQNGAEVDVSPTGPDGLQ